VHYRSADNSFQSESDTAALPFDRSPHWRKAAWDSDSRRVAVAASWGGPSVVDAESLLVASHPLGCPAVAAHADPYAAPAAVTWCGVDTVAILSYGGELRLYRCGNDGGRSDGECSGTLDLLATVAVTGGASSVGGMVFLPGPRVLVVIGAHPIGTALPTAGTPLMRAWRVLDAAPHIAPVDRTPATGAPNRGVVDRAVVTVQAALAPGGETIAVLDSDGAVHLFRAPSLEPTRCVPEIHNTCPVLIVCFLIISIIWFGLGFQHGEGVGAVCVAICCSSIPACAPFFMFPLPPLKRAAENNMHSPNMCAHRYLSPSACSALFESGMLGVLNAAGELGTASLGPHARPRLRGVCAVRWWDEGGFAPPTEATAKITSTCLHTPRRHQLVPQPATPSELLDTSGTEKLQSLNLQHCPNSWT
jgi:hypothetical protein